jgi:formylglycine-generating enzyme required for sulfatase activity
MKGLILKFFLLVFVFLFLLPSSVLADWSVWETPVVYFDFETGQAKTLIKDKVGNNNLTLAATSGTPTGVKTRGKYGWRAEFNGTTDYGVANDSATFSQTGSFSVEAWVQFDTISSTDTTIQTVLAKWDETTNIRSYRLIIQTDSTGRAFPKFQVSTDGTSGNIKTATGKTQILPGIWYLFQGYYNAGSPGNIYIYINGVREGSATSVGTSISDTAANFYLGTTKTGASTYANFLDGSLDEVRLLSGTRDDGSLAYSMERGKPVAKLEFDDGSGFQTVDRSPQNHRAALINFPTDNSEWVAGNNNYALQFDGSDDYVDLGSHNDYQLGGAITISTWIYVTSLGNYALVSQPNTNGYTFQMTSGGELTFGALGGTTVTSTGASIPTSEWTHLAVSYDGVNASFYVDGRLVSSPALALWATADGAVLAGKAGSTPNYFHGKMDDLLIYSYNRTLFEIYTDMLGGAVKFGKTQALASRNVQVACPTGFVHVPGDPLYGTGDFCVMKYEAKCASTSDPTTGIQPAAGNACSGENAGDYYGTYKNNTAGCYCSSANSKQIVSVASGFPIAYIAQDDGSVNDAKSYCEANGWHLITNNEWMTIARNAERQGANWCDSNGNNCGFTPGQSGKILAAGHNDNVNDTAAGGDGNSAIIASSNDSYACYGTNTGVTVCNGGASQQKRTHTLSNGEVIWDLAGNVWEWTDNVVQRKDEPECQGSACVVGWQWSDFASGSTNSYLLNNGQGSAMGYDVIRPSNPLWNANQGVGRIYHYSDPADVNTTGYAFLRGARWVDGSSAGVFALNLFNTPGHSGYYHIGFRCAVAPQ